MSIIRSVIRGCGAYLPAKILTNEDLSRLIETTDEWIQERTGIKERHIAADGEFTSDLGLGYSLPSIPITPMLSDFGRSVRMPVRLKEVTQRAYSLSTGNNCFDREAPSLFAPQSTQYFL